LAKICLCLSAKTLERNLEILGKYRKYADIAELRVDCLDPNERLMIRRFPELADIPVILTIRRVVDGGFFDGGEGARINLMARGLAYADADKRRNFAYLDLENDLDVPSLEEAARTFGTRIIRSYHNIETTDADLPFIIRSIPHSGNDIIKASVKANSTRDVLSLLRAGRECTGQDKILIAMGHYGIYSRILAEKFGSFMNYSAVLNEPDISISAPGQVDIKELAELYRFHKITANTKVYGVIGHPLKSTGSPRFFNTIFNIESINAVYVPFPVDSLSTFFELAQELKVCGLSVTVPYKEAVIPFLNNHHLDIIDIGACNTLLMGLQGWEGTNTDARGFSDSLLKFYGKSNIKKHRVTVIGAGGAAQAVVHELHRLGAKILILNRSAYKARDLAARYKCKWGGLDNRGIEMMDKFHDIIIQATSLGMDGCDTAGSSTDPVEMYRFSGKEEVMDLVYNPEMTPFLKRAANAGCRYQNGYDMLIRQACYQYARFTGKDFPEHLTSRVQFGNT